MDRRPHLGDTDGCRCEIQFGEGSFSAFFTYFEDTEFVPASKTRTSPHSRLKAGTLTSYFSSPLDLRRFLPSVIYCDGLSRFISTSTLTLHRNGPSLP
jgi:hypothetical protein